MHVLIIESDTSFAAGLDDVLRSRGIGTTVTADGEAALGLARSQRPAAVILSLELGDRLSAGFSWCNRFKRDEGLRSIPLILTSSLATEETFEHHGRLRTRADSYLHKPFPPERLLEELSSFLPLDGPPAGSAEGLADELLQILPEDELETLETDEITDLPGTDLATADVPGGDEPLAARVDDDFDLPSIPVEELSAFPEDEGLDDLFADLAAPVPEPEKTVTEYALEPVDGPSDAEEALRRELDEARTGREEAEREVRRLRGQVEELQARLATANRQAAELEDLRMALHESAQRSDRLAAELEALEEQGRSRAEELQADLQRRDRLRELLEEALRLNGA